MASVSCSQLYKMQTLENALIYFLTIDFHITPPATYTIVRSLMLAYYKAPLKIQCSNRRARFHPFENDRVALSVVKVLALPKYF
jgi:hypothetical protein